MLVESLRSTIPARRETARLCLGSFGFSVAGWLLWPTWLGCATFAFFFPLGVLFLAAMVIPDRFVKGVRLIDGGFEVWRPLRKPLYIKYVEIKEILAIARSGGDANDDLTFKIYTGKVCVMVDDVDFFGSDLQSQISSLVGFSRSELQRAMQHQATFLQAIFGKKFLIFCAGNNEPERV